MAVPVAVAPAAQQEVQAVVLRAAPPVAQMRAVIQIMEPVLRALAALVEGRALALPARRAVVQALLGPALPGVRPAGRTRAGMEREVRARLLVAAAPVPGRAALGVAVRLAAVPAEVQPVGPVRPLLAPLVRAVVPRLEAVRAEVRRLDRAALEQVLPLLAAPRPAQEVVVQVLPPAAAPAEVRPADLARVA